MPYRNVAENFNGLSRVHERYRQTDDRRQTIDGRATAYSERERHEPKFFQVQQPLPGRLPLYCRIRTHLIQSIVVLCPPLHQNNSIRWSVYPQYTNITYTRSRACAHTQSMGEAGPWLPR